MLRTAAVCAILLLGAPPAFADQCDNAVNKYNSSLDEASSWWLQNFKETFGAIPKEYNGEWDGVDFCAKFLPLLYKRLAYEKEVDRFDAVQRSVCGSRLHMTGEAPGGQNATSTSMVPRIQKNIDNCEATLKGR